MTTTLSNSPSKSRKVRLVCVSDTHNHAPGEGYTLPKGDILIHAGDLTNQGSISEIEKAVAWLEKADFACKIVVAGNHDLSLDETFPQKHDGADEKIPEQAEECRNRIRNAGGITYLEHSGVVVQTERVSLRVFASPYSPDRGGHEWAFQYAEEQADDLWAAVPDDTDILITHTPPADHMDSSKHWTSGGCASLTRALRRVRPLVHVCGHCHEGRGAQIIRWKHDSDGGEDETVLWEDPGEGTKKQSLLKLTGASRLKKGEQTAVVKASIMKTSWTRGGVKDSNKAIIVDVEVPTVPVSVSPANGLGGTSVRDV